MRTKFSDFFHFQEPARALSAKKRLISRKFATIRGFDRAHPGIPGEPAASVVDARIQTKFGGILPSINRNGRRARSNSNRVWSKRIIAAGPDKPPSRPLMVSEVPLEIYVRRRRVVVHFACGSHFGPGAGICRKLGCAGPHLSNRSHGLRCFFKR
jgi:hypothetical protein